MEERRPKSQQAAMRIETKRLRSKLLLESDTNVFICSKRSTKSTNSYFYQLYLISDEFEIVVSKF